MTKIGLISDIHGHITAAKAVIEDAKKNGVTEFWCMGDIVMPGPGSSDLIQLLKENNTTVFVKGNWDSCFTDTLTECAVNEEDMTDIYVARLAQYHTEQMSDEDIQFMMTLPMSIEKTVYGVKFQISHAMPEQNYGSYLSPDQPQEHFEALLKDSDADAAIYGHVHRQLYRPVIDGRMVINPGAVIKHAGERSHYAMLEIEEDGNWSIQFKQVAHDVAAELTLARTKDLPYYELYENTMMTGINYTHNKEILAEVTERNGYLNDVSGWLNKL